MADIKDSVSGPGSRVEDIAMIQMMLKVVKDAKGAPYLKVNYSGTWGGDTKDAIIRFQKDCKLIELAPEPAKDIKDAKAGAPAKAVAPPGVPGKTFDKEGLVALGSATLKKLNEMLPPAYKDASILPGSTCVYFADTPQTAGANSARIRTEAQLDMAFAIKASDFVTNFYQETKIALSVTNTGLRRDFQGQMRVISQAGPGESNHQYGLAADIGFGGLRWVDGDGTIRVDTWWLNLGENPKTHKLPYMTPEKSKAFWAAHHKVAYGKSGLNPTSLPGDESHVQSYPDAHVSMARSLAKLLNSAGDMKWDTTPHIQKQQNKFKSDFALGGKSFVVGTGKQIFAGMAVINKADVVTALVACKKDLAKLNIFKQFQFVKDAVKNQKLVPGKQPPPITAAKVTFKDVTEVDIELLRKAAKEDWVKADRNWKSWVPVH